MKNAFKNYGFGHLAIPKPRGDLHPLQLFQDLYKRKQLELGSIGCIDKTSLGVCGKPKRRYTQTTMSRHYLRKWPNIVRNLEIKEPDQLWVSDITYIRTEEGNCYLNMVTDAYGRKIVGCSIDVTMETTSMINTLKMATRQKINTKANTIHHSDRGLQYCSKEYATLTAKNNIRLSMTENSDPYEKPWQKE